jgi:hypothetical protein
MKYGTTVVYSQKAANVEVNIYMGLTVSCLSFMPSSSFNPCMQVVIHSQFVIVR